MTDVDDGAFQRRRPSGRDGAVVGFVLAVAAVVVVVLVATVVLVAAIDVAAVVRHNG